MKKEGLLCAVVIIKKDLPKEGAPTALYLTSFQIVVSQSDARYTYRHAITNYTIPTIIIN